TRYSAVDAFGNPLNIPAGIRNNMITQRSLFVMALTCVIAAPLASTRADEGMWLFNDPPRKLLKERHNFDISDAWLEHVQKSSVRFNSGGSGSFVSETAWSCPITTSAPTHCRRSAARSMITSRTVSWLAPRKRRFQPKTS